MRPLIAGNWKMNGMGQSLAELTCVARWLCDNACAADLLICPPFTLISRAAAAAKGRVALGGQDCHPLPAGAFTGDVSAEMLRDAGASAVIVGHSERRRYHGESDEMIASKVEAAWRAGLLAILCVGETESERDAGLARDVVVRQIEAGLPSKTLTAKTLAIAYEPVWSIGTGRIPADDEIAGMHTLVRSRLCDRFAGGEAVRILYGGSVKPANAAGILRLPNVNGALIGGASLVAANFLEIACSVPRG